uniref:Glucose-methanol-choline oxidoreductase N-terminal domain-containing protein n=1 Tax=Arion vulgaris TaxID=1028688 RepID=A0A0B7ANQ3_9EUPU
MKVSVPNTLALSNILVQAGQDLGLQISDPNGASLAGISHSQSHTFNGIRWSTSRGFLHPVLSRPNLHVRINTHVTKILLENKKAVGVEMIYGGRKEKVRVAKEVILSAGSIGSPHILMLSGIGPKNHLKQHGIPVVADLPVGDNLQDHLYYDFCVGINQSMTATRELQQSFLVQAQYKLFGTGVLSSSHYVEVLVFDNTGEESKKKNWPDLQIMFHETPSSMEGMRTFGYKDEIISDFRHRSTHKDYFECEPALLRPQSRGTIKLRSIDPFDYPIIDPDYLHAQEDVDLLVRGIKYCKRFVNSLSLQRLGAAVADKPGILCKEHEYDTDAYWGCMVRQTIHTIYHPSGTCKMGKSEDKTTVVDHRLRVHGIQGLRVADASIMPYITSANINAPVIMIGEKASHMIREDRANRKK